VLDGIVHTPYFTPEGDLITKDGYNPATHLYLATNGLRLPPVPVLPSYKTVQRAVKLLMDEWLGDFPFADEASKAVPIALLLTLTGRDAFFDLSPLIVLDASTPGSGKGLLIDTSTVIATGGSPHLLQLPAQEEEQRKKVSTALLDGRDPFVWDECHVVAGLTLAMILTAEVYSDRLLGGNKMLSVRNRFCQVAAGNNVEVRGDMQRRVVPCRLEPLDGHPERRTDFKHPDLKVWVREHRPELLAAGLTLWRNYIAEGRPSGPVTMGSFERWSASVGGCLEAAGITGFLSKTADWLDVGNPDEDWESHLIQVADHFGLSTEFTASQVANQVDLGSIDLPYRRANDHNPLAKTIGNMYRRVRGRWWGQHQLVSSSTRNSSSGGRSWMVKKKGGFRRRAPAAGSRGPR
jgi:hypothetical protein